MAEPFRSQIYSDSIDLLDRRVEIVEIALLDRDEEGPGLSGRRSEDAIREFPEALRVEPRWPVALAVFGVVFLLEALPARVRVFPIWVPYVVGVAEVVPMAVITMTAGVWWRRVERTITLILFLLAVGGMLTGLVRLFSAMVRRSEEFGGKQLLTGSIKIWVINVLAFSLLYWQMDRGGPEARQNNASPMPDWIFPQEGARENVPSDWHPTFIDYFFLGYSTATAFSSTDMLPLTYRAKILMMLQSAIALVTIVAVVSRAINVLGG